MKTWLVVLVACLMGASTAFAQPVPVTITPIADVTVTVTATLIKAYTPTRYALSCTNNGTEDVRWGNASVTATTGQLFQASSSIEIKTVAAVYMITASATSTVSCTEELR